MGGKSKKTTVGYKYYMDIQAGLGRGPVNEIVSITADDKIIFAGTAGEISASKTIFINKADLFGGTDTGGEGGIKGYLEIAMGNADQVPSGRVTNLLKGLVPGFRGIVSTFFTGLVSAYSASAKPWLYRVRRSTRGWDSGVVWYAEKAIIKLRNDMAEITDSSLSAEQISNVREIHAMNAAHILVEAATNRDWGRGLVLTQDLNLDSYRAMADTIYNEGSGLCFRYNRQDSLDTFIQQVLDHVGAVQYGDLSTGKLKVKLIRNDYNADELPLFNYDNGILNVQEDATSASYISANEIVVTWHDPVTNTEGTARAQNLGSIHGSDVGLISESISYKGIPTFSLAARVAERDLEAVTGGLKRFTLRFDRRGGVLEPAGCFRLSLPDLKIENMVVRVGKMVEENGGLTITVIQDVFGLPATSYSSGQQPPAWTPPDITPLPVVDQRLIELPYVALASTVSASELASLPDDAGFIGVVAAPPQTSAINYSYEHTSGSGWSTEHNHIGDWTPSARLLSDAGRLDTVLQVVSPGDVRTGSAALIGGEIVRIDGTDLIEKNSEAGSKAGADKARGANFFSQGQASLPGFFSEPYGLSLPSRHVAR